MTDENANSVGSRCSLSSEEPQESYVPLRVLGRGAFGQAVLYRRADDNSLVVWKEIELPKVSDEEKDRSLNEVDILSLLDHINIISYYNHFFDDFTLYIEMEYANGGTLFEKIRDQKELIPEEECAWYFYQLMSAVLHIHDNGIMHRDIKTLNIFMTKAGVLKLGDFGISKALEDNGKLAETNVGTPYYMSPELVRGEKYDNKSDIWACGCVLYELLSLKKVFDSTNQLGLMCAILENDVENVDPIYSKGLQTILNSLLDKDFEKRPTAKQVLELEYMEKFTSKYDELLKDNYKNISARNISSRSMSNSCVPVVSSLTSEIYWWGGGKIIPQKLEVFKESNAGLDIATGHSHFAVVTAERELFTWANIQGGTSIVGQLGHGDQAMYRLPKRVDFFLGIPVMQVACGEDFTAILTEDGILYMTGSDYWGCIGWGQCGDEEVLTPVKVEKFTNSDIKVTQVACGDSHVIALSEQGDVYSWGCGELGRLGLNHEDDMSTPQHVEIPKCWSDISSVHCGRDNTFLLTNNGILLAFGSNENNKIALNQTIQLKKGKQKQKTDIVVVHSKASVTMVRSLKSFKIKAVAAGKDHSAVVEAYGRLVTFGDNRFGQLGTGDHKKMISPYIVKGNLVGKEVTRVGCGDGFTVIATSDNQVFSWGSGDNGRLGVSQGVLGGKSSSAVPRPIFGSLHKVASLKCRHWHTIILGERVHGSRVIQKTASFPDSMMSNASEQSFKLKSLSGFQSADSASGDNYASVFDDVTQSSLYESNASLEDSNNDTTPLWLKQEFDDAEVIQLKSKATSNVSDTVNEEEDLPPWLAQELHDADFIPIPDEKKETNMKDTSRDEKDYAGSTEANSSSCASCGQLNDAFRESRRRIRELEAQNKVLIKKLEEQDAFIKTLKKQNRIYTESNKKLLELSGNLR